MVVTLAMADAVTKLLIVVTLQSLTPQIAFLFFRRVRGSKRTNLFLILQDSGV
jgi:hypothetical protein